jgi:hypothetical protein
MGTLTPPNDSASAARFLPSAECSLLGFVGQTSFFQIPEIRSNQTEKQISSALSSPRRACRTPLGAACSSAEPADSRPGHTPMSSLQMDKSAQAAERLFPACQTDTAGVSGVADPGRFMERG